MGDNGCAAFPVVFYFLMHEIQSFFQNHHLGLQTWKEAPLERAHEQPGLSFWPSVVTETSRPGVLRWRCRDGFTKMLKGGCSSLLLAFPPKSYSCLCCESGPSSLPQLPPAQKTQEQWGLCRRTALSVLAASCLALQSVPTTGCMLVLWAVTSRIPVSTFALQTPVPRNPAEQPAAACFMSLAGEHGAPNSN